LKAKRSKKEEVVVEKENKVQNTEVVDIKKVEKEGEGNA
jgi:hypothetical protein